jgi:hypothetical protein
MMQPCITVKGKQHRHQVVYSGINDEVHCVNHCGLAFLTKKEQEQFFEWDRQLGETRWPEGAEL